MNRKLFGLLLFATQSGLGLVVPTHADEPQSAKSSPEASSEANTLSEIVVTARRKSELLEDIPQTVTAVGSGDFEKLNLQNLQDISGVVPGLQILPEPGGAQDTNTFRGVSFNPATGTQNTLAFYLNDVWVTNNFVNTSNFDVGQMEVLSGPQGTLRGEPSPSGSLTITTHRPDLERFGGYVTVTGTAYGNANENGAINLPIIQDKLAVRLAGISNTNDFDGVKSDFSSADPYSHTYGGRASIRFQPIDSVEANVMYQHLFQHIQSYAQVAGPGASGGVDPNAPAGYNGPPISPFDRRGVQSYPSENYNTDDIFTGQLDWHVLGQLVSYDGGYWKYVLNGGNVADAAHQVPGIDTATPIPRLSFQFNTPFSDQQSQTQELRIASETPVFGFLDYTAGFFYRNTRDGVDFVQQASFLGGSFGSPVGAPNPFIYSPNYLLQLLIQAPKQEKEYSEFVNLTFHLPQDTELAVGGRYLSYKTNGFTQGTLLPNGVLDALALPINCGAFGFGSTYPGSCDIPLGKVITNTNALPYVPQNLSANTFIYNVSLSHKLNPNFLVYINSGSSWRPPAVAIGIFNAANDPELNSLLHVQPEKSYSFEGGFKWTFLDNRARLNLSYYHQQFNNFIYQGLPALYLDDNGSGTPTATNFVFTTNPSAVVNGIDLDSGFQFTRQWNLNLAASYSNGHLTGSSIPCSPPSGGTTPAAFPPGTHVFLCPSHASVSTNPNFTTTATTEYDTPVPNTAIEAFIRGLYTFYGRNPHASQYYVTPSYGLLNVYLGLRSPDGAWEGSLFVKNALDTQRILSTSVGTPAITAIGLNTLFGSSGYYNAELTPRREAGLTFTYSFGSR